MSEPSTRTTVSTKPTVRELIAGASDHTTSVEVLQGRVKQLTSALAMCQKELVEMDWKLDELASENLRLKNRASKQSYEVYDRIFKAVQDAHPANFL